MLQRLLHELEHRYKDCNRLRNHIDRSSHQLERDEKMAKEIQAKAKAAAARKLAEEAELKAAAAVAADNKESDVGLDGAAESGSPSKAKLQSEASGIDSGGGAKDTETHAGTAAASPVHEASASPTDKLALELDKYKAQYVISVGKYYYLYDLIQLIESDGTQLMFRRCLKGDEALNMAPPGSGPSTVGLGGREVKPVWVDRPLSSVEVDVHACHEFIPPPEDSESEEEGAQVAGKATHHHHHHRHRHHHHHHHHHHHRGGSHANPEHAHRDERLQPKKDELGRLHHNSVKMLLLDEERHLSCRRIGVPMLPAQDIIHNLSYYQLSTGVSSSEYSLKMFRHHIDRFSGIVNPRAYVSNHNEIEEAEAALEEEINELIEGDPEAEQEEADFDPDFLANLGKTKEEKAVAASEKAAKLAAATPPPAPFPSVMSKCVASIKYPWGFVPPPMSNKNSHAGTFSPLGARDAHGNMNQNRRDTAATVVTKLDNEDPYLLPISNTNHDCSQFIQYPLLQGHTVLSSNHLLRSERIRCESNLGSIQEQIRVRLQQQKNEGIGDEGFEGVGSGNGGFGSGGSVASGGTGITGVTAGSSVSLGSAGVAKNSSKLHVIPPPMVHVNSARHLDGQVHGSGTNLVSRHSHVYNQICVYKLVHEPPARFIQHQMQDLLSIEHARLQTLEANTGTTGGGGAAAGSGLEDNAGATSMEELSSYIPDPVSKRSNPNKKKSIKERVASVIYITNNNNSIPTTLVPDADSTYCHISRLLDVVKIMPISSDSSDIGVVLIYVNGIEVTHDMLLHDKDLITIVNQSTNAVDAISCYKFFQVRIPREASALERARKAKAIRLHKLETGELLDSDEENEMHVTEEDDHRPTTNASARSKSSTPALQQVGSALNFHSQFAAVSVSNDFDMNESTADLSHMTDIQKFLLFSGGTYLTLQEVCLWIMYAHHLIEILIQCEKGRYHELHTHEVDRHLLPTLKSYETSEMAGLLSYEPDMDWIMNIQSFISWEEKAKLCYLMHAISVANFFSDGMQRDQIFKGKCLLLVSTEPEVQAGAGNDMTLKTDLIFSIDMVKNYRSRATARPKKEGEPVKVSRYDSTATKLMSTKYRRYVFQVQCSSTNDSGNWLWNIYLFYSRFFLMRSMYHDYIDLCSRNFFQLNGLYPNVIDPFVDIPSDEVIGVSCVYLSSLYHLVDIDDSFPIINFAGYNSGCVKCSVRAWIDRIETIPSYITVDKEVVLDDFIDRKMIIRININSLQDIPEHLSTGTYVTFKFFYHSKMYQTNRYCGKTTTPMIKGTIAIEQKITVDFIESIRTGYIDMEVGR